jgi:hypothetical protein
MPPRGYLRTVRIERRRHNAEAPTSHFVFEGGRRHGNSRVSFIAPEHCPEFDGDAAIAQIERVSGKPWGHYRVVRIVEVVG